MGYAEVIRIEEYREEKRGEEFRKRMHEELDEWLDRMEEKMKDKGRPSLKEMSDEIKEMRGELTKRVMEEWIERKYEEEKEGIRKGCKRCGRELRGREQEEQVIETLMGEIKIKRRYSYCEECKEGYYPLDEELGLSGRRKQEDIQRAVVELTKEIPYGEACELVGKLAGVKVSLHTAHEITGEIGEGLGVLEGSPSREEVMDRIEKMRGKSKEKPIGVLSVDGAYAPVRGEKKEEEGAEKGTRGGKSGKGERREAKGVRFYLVKGQRIEHMLSWQQIQGEEGMYGTLKRIKEAGLIPEERIRLCVIADGAKWIWKQVKELFATAQEILDYYHASPYIHRIGESQYQDEPEKGVEWVEGAMARLFCDEVGAVIRSLGQMKPRHEEAKVEIEKTLSYLKQNRERMKYGSYKEAGYPVGSGGIESAHKFICQIRLKRSGAWWKIDNGNKMLALRCAKYNGTLDRVLDKYFQTGKNSGF